MTKYLSSTSRNLEAANYAWDSVVHQFGRPLLDSELNLSQDILKQRLNIPSGMVSQHPVNPTHGEFLFVKPYTGSYPNKVLNPDFSPNTLYMRSFTANVNGMKVEVKGTNSTDPLLNKVTLSTPEESGRLVDFVFLEVWRREVTPSMGAKARIRVSSPLNGDLLSFNIPSDGVTLTAGVDYQVSASQPETARNIADSINDYDGAGLGLTLGSVTVTAETRGTRYVFLSLTGGVDGNYPNFTISSSSSGVVVVDQPSGGSDGEGKPDANHVYYSGNVDSHSDLWLVDDIQDPTLEVSSSRRVQVQYRLRVHPMLSYNVSDHIFGFNYFNLFAQGSLSAPHASATFVRHSSDNGLWVAGDGSETLANELGTVDGYVYAMPVAFVYRRNQPVGGTQGFDALSRFNTGALHDHDGTSLLPSTYVDNVPATLSDRPDGYFSDEIAQEDVLDMRRRVFPYGVDYSSELNRQFHELLDTRNKTWVAEAHNLADTGNGTAGVSHTPLMCDAFGDSSFVFNAGEYKRTFDHIVRRFSNEPTIERFFVPVYPRTDSTPNPNVPGVAQVPADPTQEGWHEGDVLVFDLTAMQVDSRHDWYTANLGLDAPTDRFPVGTKIIDVGMCWHDDGHYVNDVTQDAFYTSAQGLGTNTLSITLGANTQLCNGGLSGGIDYPLVSNDPLVDGSRRALFVEFIVEYPSGNYGLTAPVAQVPNADTGVYPFGVGVQVGGQALYVTDINVGVGNSRPKPIVTLREAKQDVTLEEIGNAVSHSCISRGQSFTYLPFRVYGDTSTITVTDVSDALNPVPLTLNEAECQFGHSEPKISWNEVWGAGQRNIQIDCYPLVAPTAATMLVYYNRQAPQTCGSDFPLAQAQVSTNNGGVVPYNLELEPLAMGDKVSGFMRSSFTYPFSNPTYELGSSPLGEVNGYDEYLVMNTNEVFLDDLGINTGAVDLPSFVSLASSVNLVLGSLTTPPQKDGFNRVVYPAMGEGSYVPATFAKNMTNLTRDYKTAVPCLMKVVTDDHDLYRRGEVLLVVFVKTNTWGQSVAVDMTTDSNTNLVVACVYRTRNLLLLGE